MYIQPAHYRAIILWIALLMALRGNSSQPDEVKNMIAGKRSWILPGAGIKDWKHGSPLCSHVSMNALGTPYTKSDSAPAFNRSVGLYNVRFKPVTEWNALWVYNSTTYALQVLWPDATTYCLDNMNQTSYNPNVPFPFKILPCTGGLTQQWLLEPVHYQTSEASVCRIKSPMVAPNGQPLYIRGQKFQTPYPWLVLGLYLDSVDDGSAISEFTFIPIPPNNQSLASVAVTAPSPGDGSNNLIANGGFESYGLQGPNDFKTLEVTVKKESPYICSWTVVEGAVKIVQTSPWSWRAIEGLNSLLLGAHTAGPIVKITQFVKTIPSMKYFLTFYVYGGTLCYKHQAHITKTVTVEISPSTNSSALERHIEHIHVTRENQPVQWTMKSLSFTALSNATNITFISTMNRPSCAAAIDNVVLSLVHDTVDNMFLKKLLIATSLTSVLSVLGLIFLVKDRICTAQTLYRYRYGTKITDGFVSSAINSSSELGPVSTFSLKQLKVATDNFQTKVGQGAFGIVYRAKLQKGNLGAVKRATRGYSNPHLFRQELSVLLRLRHENLVNLIGFCCEKGEQILVFEYMSNGTLFERLHGTAARESDNILPWKNRMLIAFDIAQALLYLHEKAVPQVIHRDVKSANILLTEHNAGKLADFGMSKLGSHHVMLQEEASTPPQGSFGYVDPHYHWTGQLSEKSDVYSYGVVLLEMVTGLKAMQGHETLAESLLGVRLQQEDEAMTGLADPRLNGQFDMEELRKVTRIINCCLHDDPEQRPFMRQVVEWLAGSEQIDRPRLHHASPPCDYYHSPCIPNE